MITKVEISKKALKHNIDSFRSILEPKTKFFAIIKSNAYGHGILEIANLSKEFGVDGLGVNSIEEAILIHEHIPEIPILIMGEPVELKRYWKEINSNRFIFVVSRLEQVKKLNQLSNKPKIHLKTDTGMGRLGHSGNKLFRIIQELKKEKLRIDGMMMHFASTEDFTEHSYSMFQLNNFNQYIQYANKNGFKKLIHHASSSASTMLFKEARLDMVRIGISLYGLWPSVETRLSLSLMGNQKFKLEPVLSWKTGIVHLQTKEIGEYIGYGSTYKTTYPSKVAVIPVGYNEGLDRRLSNQGYVLIHGERAKIIGRICMNMSMIDITHIKNAKVGDEVIIIGSSQKDSISADTIANLTGTINYDIVTRIHISIPRIVID